MGLDWDARLELYSFGDRLYDPFAGRLLNANPAAEAAAQNPYVFANNSPVDRDHQDARAATTARSQTLASWRCSSTL